MTGYFGTSLVCKLGIEAGHRLVLIAAPAGSFEALDGLPDDVDLRHAAEGPADVVVAFHRDGRGWRGGSAVRPVEAVRRAVPRRLVARDGGAGSDGHDADVGVVGGESSKIVRVVGEDQPAAEAGGGGHDEGVDGQFAAGADCGQGVSGEAGGPGPGGHDPGETASQLPVDHLVRAAAAVELEQDGGRHADRFAPALRRTHRRANPLVPVGRGVRSGQGREGFGVQDQGHSAS